MGLRDFFKRRKDRESAYPDGMSLAGQVHSPTDQLGQAAAGTKVEVSGDAQTIDMRGSGAREDILKLLANHGVEAEKGDQVSVTDGDLQKQIFEVLGQHGLDIEQLAGLSNAMAEFSGFGTDPVSRIEHLDGLRKAGVLSEEDFAAAKAAILKSGETGLTAD